MTRKYKCWLIFLAYAAVALAINVLATTGIIAENMGFGLSNLATLIMVIAIAINFLRKKKQEADK